MKKKTSKIVNISPRGATLKRKIRKHLRGLGFKKTKDGFLYVADGSKDSIRLLHSSQRNDRLEANRRFISERAFGLLRHFASGEDINPARISPTIERISSGTWQSDLFRLASLTWSVPVSQGFGRRLRYLVWDEQNEKLIGLIAIGDPVFNLSVRDDLIEWDSNARRDRLVNVMDAYVLGALPPYSMLLGGKMVACLVRSRELYDDFAQKYGATAGVISRKKKKSRLFAVTTSSSMGRSSVYNRLRLDGEEYFSSIGYTDGWGHFHIPDNLFSELRNYLREIKHPYADMYRFGDGPNWRLRATRAALSALGFRNSLLRHGIQREVFFCAIASNAVELLRTGKGSPNISSLLSSREVARKAVERWMIPRSERRDDYRHWTTENLISLFGKDSWFSHPRQTRVGNMM